MNDTLARPGHGKRLPEISVRSGDPDEAREVGTRIYHRHDVTVLGNAAHFAMSLDAASLGPMTVGWLTYDTEVRIASAHEGFYEVNVPTAGALLTRTRGKELLAGPQTATVYLPDLDATFGGWAVPEPMLALRIARRAVEHELEQLLERPIPGPVDFSLSMDVGHGRGAQWWALLRSLADDLTDEDCLARQPMVAAPFVHSLITGLLLSADHPFRDELDAPAPAAGLSTVRAAREFIDTHAADALTVADIARAAGVGVRGLQQSFQRTLGVSPMQYLRDVRLRHAHRLLLAAEPDTITVGAAARTWGFAHQGRFAVEYRSRYGVAPSETLRSTS